MAGLTSDNSLLSDQKTENQIDLLCNSRHAINCTLNLSPAIATYVQASLSANTRKPYLSDLAQFEAWGGTVPCTKNTVAAYLADHATRLKPATLARQLVSIGKAHRARGLPSPIKSELVKAVLNGIKRSYGQPQKAAKPLLRDDLFLVLDKMGQRPKDIRDRALLLLGFAGGFRRSELVGLDVEDIEFVRQGLVITLKRSKTDQYAQGRKIGIPFGRTRYCPVLALESWLNTSSISTGPIFKPVSRHGKINGGAPFD